MNHLLFVQIEKIFDFFIIRFFPWKIPTNIVESQFLLNIENDESIEDTTPLIERKRKKCSVSGCTASLGCIIMLGVMAFGIVQAVKILK